MKLNAPKFTVWLIAVVLGGCGILIKLGIFSIPALAGYQFFMVAAAFVLLVLATFLKGL